MDKQEILLKEYELCQQDIIDTSSRYWTVVNIFMAVSTAILGAIAATIISGNFIKYAFQRDTSPQILVAGSVIIVLGGGMISVLKCLKDWLRRVNCLATIHYERMREIETQLGMWKNWRVHGIDNWNNSKKITPEDKVRLTEYQPEGWWKKRQSKLKEYASPNTNPNRRMLQTLIVVWALIVLLAIIVIVRNRLS